MQACDRCHKRKTKCDKLNPCGPCTKAATHCVYSDKSSETYRKEVVERLEREKRQLEQANRTLQARLEALRSPSQRTAAGSDTPSESIAQSRAFAGHRASNDAVSELSFLSTAAGGDRQFLGSASGLLFANIVNASVITAVERDANDDLPDPSSSVLTAGVQHKPEWTIDDNSLPPLALSRLLINAYLAHDHICYPCLHPNEVRRILDAIYKDQLYYGQHVAEAFFFDMLLAIGTSQVHKFNWQALPDAETHHMRAMLRLNAVLARGGLEALQAMLLLCQYRLSSSTKDTSGSQFCLWHLVGVAARMSLELGLHRESVYNSKLREDNVVRSLQSPDFELQEVRRRCFWCVFALDRIVSITLGRPLAICLEDIDVEMPQADIGDVTSPLGIPQNDKYGNLQGGGSSRAALFNHIVRYRTLCGKFLTSLHRSSRNMDQPEMQLRRLQEELTIELEKWRADTENLRLTEVDLSSPIEETLSSFKSKAWYELLYHNAILLLYRPAPSLSPSDTSSDISRVFASAKQSITLYSYLFRSRKINFSWMVLHAVFMAGLSYVYAVSRDIRERRKRQALLPEPPSIVEIVNDCRACSQVLVAVSERCNAQKSCHEVFDRLSDAVIADAVDLISTKSRSASDTRALTQQATITGAPIAASSHNFGVHDQADHAFNQVNGIASDPTYQRLDGGQLGPTFPDAYSTHLNQFPAMAPLATDNAIQDCFPDIQQIYDAQWGDDAILHLSMDWLGDINSSTKFM